MPYSIGDRVRFMDSMDDGRVVAVPDDSTLLIEVDGMRMRVSVMEVVPVSSCSLSEEKHLYDANNQISRFKERQRPPVRSVRSGKKAARSSAVMEIDLHLDAVRRKYPAARNIPDSDALYLQLDIFEKSMAEAFRRGVRSVVFIHGNGRGILRGELIRRLKEYPGVDVCEASLLRYGGGAIEVLLK
ncbi:MAG TPA: Smr/MutS family protein [Candidatus Coprenecus pullistercoris]|nr:Smr/MutS family protein [Candidatus Coprenecus pullistercoris]